MRKARPSLVTCVLNWNRPDDTIACVESLLASEAADQHVLVVDNGSSDDSIARLRARFGSAIEVLATGANRYYAGGMNAGIERAMSLNADLILLLNNDTVVAPDAVSWLVAAAEARPDAGILAPAVYYLGERRRFWSLGSRRSPWRPFPAEVGRGAVDRGEYTTPMRVDFVTGCAMLICREVVERIGLLDEGYRFYFEDADYCARARAAGYDVLVEPRARIYHAVAQSASREPATVRYLKTRGRARFYRSYAFGPAPLFTHVALCAQEAARALAGMLRGDRAIAAAIWRGLLDGYREPIDGRQAEAPVIRPYLPQ
jgi:GT2 family glycosyltransferase